MSKPVLDFIFSKANHKNTYARSVVQLKVYEALLKDYDINVINPRSIIKKGHAQGPDSIDSIQVMTIANPANNKAIVFNVGPKVGGPFSVSKGWADFDVVQIIGGASVSKAWYDNLNVERKNYFDSVRSTTCFPLDQTTHEKEALNFKPPAISKKINQAIFIGNTQNLRGRIELTKILNKHPLFKIIDRKEGGMPFPEYLKEIYKYKMSISLNGFAEACYRDWESMSVGVPILRSEFYSQYNSPIIPDFHYISGSEPTINGETEYKSSFNNVAEQFIDRIESTINDDKFLNEIANNGREYFVNNITCDSIVEKFLKEVKLDSLFDD